MDTSETYIKMCEKAEEIQRGHKPELYDLRAVWIPKQQRTPPDGTAMLGEYKVYEIDEFGIWLPRQDQLQEMVMPHRELGDLYPHIKLAFELAKFANNQIFITDSMEQLWLAFVMKEKYNKAWTNNEWRNGSE